MKTKLTSKVSSNQGLGSPVDTVQGNGIYFKDIEV